MNIIVDIMYPGYEELNLKMRFVSTFKYRYPCVVWKFPDWEINYTGMQSNQYQHAV